MMMAVATGCLAISLLIMRFRGVTPASLLLLFYTICFVTYWTVFDLALRKSEIFGVLGLSYSATPLSEHPSSFASVIVLYTILSIGLALMSLVWPPRENRPERRPQNIALRLNAGHALITAGLAAGYLIVTLWHASVINWSTLNAFTDYISLKHPDGLGLDHPILRIYHFLMKSGGPIIFCLGIFIFSSGRRFLGSFIVLVSLYSFAFNAVTSSRYVIAYPAIIIAIALYQRRYFRSMIGAFSLLFLFNMSIVGRSQATHGFETMNIEFFASVLVSLPQAALGIFLNVFDAFITFGAAVAMAPSYGHDYIWLSFSPLPSFIDGFDGIADSAPRISASVPFSSYAEAYLFGPLALAGLLAVFAIFILSLQMWTRRYGGLMGAATLGWMLIVNQLICQYPIRNSFRFLLLTILGLLLWRIVAPRSLTRFHPVSTAR